MIKLNRNETVYYQGLEYAIFKVRDLETVLIRNKKTSEIKPVKIADLSDRDPGSKEVQDAYDIPIEAYPEEKLKKAQWRLSIITPFLNELRGNKKALIQTAEGFGLNPSTLYKWISKFDIYGNVGCLVDSDSKGGTSKGRFEENIEDAISEIIREVYLEAKSFKETYNQIVQRFEELEYEVPHKNTIRRRIKWISEYEKVSKRSGPRTAGQLYDSKVGTTPGAATPLSLVQIDHTELDIMLVDEKERKPFKRPWITILIDVCSRMVLGFYISFDPPGAYATGRAIAHAILRKENFLESIGLPDVEWPCWGKMRTLHCDNAKEFRGTMLKESCANYMINLKWRPPRTPEMGGHIERLMGTVMEELRDLPGTTKVSKEMRAKFKPENTASFTLSEFEKWFTLWVTNVYHKRAHRGIDGMAPTEKWKQGILGNSEQPGIGLPEIITDEKKLKFDLLPQFKRTVQRTGVHILKFRYYSGVLTRWINAADEKSRGKVKAKRQFVFKMDPRDISSIFFLDPIRKEYCEIPTALNIKPDRVSIWDYRRAVAKLKVDRKPINERSIYVTYKQLREMEKEATKTTKEVRKRNEREARIKKETPTKVNTPVESKATSSDSTTSIFNNSNLNIKPYEELEHDGFRRPFK